MVPHQWIAARELTGRRLLLAWGVCRSFIRNKLLFMSVLKKKKNTNPSRGPFHFRAPSRMVWRTIRSMMQHKSARCQAALERLKVLLLPAPFTSCRACLCLSGVHSRGAPTHLGLPNTGISRMKRRATRGATGRCREMGLVWCSGRGCECAAPTRARREGVRERETQVLSSDTLQCQKRPTAVSKETYCRRKSYRLIPSLPTNFPTPIPLPSLPILSSRAVEQVFEGCPPPFDKKKRMVIPEALRVTRLRPGRRYTNLGRMASEVLTIL